MIRYKKWLAKENLQFLLSILVLIAGLVLVFLGFYAIPIGEIHYTVIGTFGMFLSFVGAVWNIDIKYQFKTKELETRFDDKMKKEE
jgi:hypothetical protein